MSLITKACEGTKKNELVKNPVFYLCAMIRFFLVVAVFSCMLASLSGQSVNPFEMRHRLPKESVAAAQSLVDEGGKPINPFDVKPHREPGTSGRLSEISSGTFAPLKALPRGGNLGLPFIFWTLSFLLAFLTFSVAFNRKALARAWNSFLNDNALNIAQREAAGLVGSTPYYLLYASFVLNAGMFLFLVSRYFWQETFSNFAFLVLCVLAAALMVLSKHIVLRLIDRLTPVGEAATRYNFLIMIFNCILGIFLLPFNFFIGFSRNLEGFLVFWTLGLVLLFYVYRALRATAIGARFVSADLFHFFLYLCSVEIAPVVLLLKIAMNEGNA